MRSKKDLGLIHVYTGDGKGKTTTAMGLALRAIGHGFKVCMIQFMKGIKYGEHFVADRIQGFDIFQFGAAKHVTKGEPREMDLKLASRGIEFAKGAMDEYDIVILDEVCVAINFGALNEEQVIEAIKNKPAEVELILTGRYASSGIVSMADYVTEMKEVKHPFKEGMVARIGIER